LSSQSERTKYFRQYKVINEMTVDHNKNIVNFH